jgi:hypothetical protein
MGASTITGKGFGIAFPGNKLPALLATIRSTIPQVSEYIVGKEPTDTFRSIQAAIDAAVGEGHNQAYPTSVLVKPGIYAEDITMYAGVDVRSVDPPFSLITILHGSVTVDIAGICSWDGVDILNSSGYGLRFLGSSSQIFNITNCSIQASSECVITGNTNGNSHLYAKNLTLAPLGTNPAITTGGHSANDFWIEKGKIGNWTSGSDQLMVNHQQGSIYLLDNLIGGQVLMAVGAGSYVENGSIFTNTVPCLVTTTSSPAILVQMTFNTSAAYIIQGTGVVALGLAFLFPGTTGTFDPGLTILNVPMMFLPTTASDWSPAPANIQDAINQLAARVKALGG